MFHPVSSPGGRASSRAAFPYVHFTEDLPALPRGSQTVSVWYRSSGTRPKHCAPHGNQTVPVWYRSSGTRPRRSGYLTRALRARILPIIRFLTGTARGDARQGHAPSWPPQRTRQSASLQGCSIRLPPLEGERPREPRSLMSISLKIFRRSLVVARPSRSGIEAQEPDRDGLATLAIRRHMP